MSYNTIQYNTIQYNILYTLEVYVCEFISLIVYTFCITHTICDFLDLLKKKHSNIDCFEFDNTGFFISDHVL